MSRRFAITAFVVLLACAGAGVAAANSSEPPTRDERSQDGNGTRPQGIAEMLDVRSEEDKQRNVELIPEDQRPAFLAVEEMMSRDLIPVDGPQGFVGWVRRDELNRPTLPDSEADLIPIYAKDGSVAGYFGIGIGAIDKFLVEAPGELDLQAVMADRGITHMTSQG